MMYGTAAQLDELSIGMTKDQVIQKLGAPVSTGADSDKHEEHLIFKKMKGTVSWAPKLYDVTLRDGKVIKWGEQYQ